MKKKLLFRAFALVVAMSCAVGVHAYDFAASGLYFNIIGTRTVEVTYNDNNSNYTSYSGDVTIPSTVNYGGTTYDVVTIGKNAFRNSTGLTGVTIPSSITSIDYFAFYQCTNLTSVSIPSSVKYIYHDAFGKTGLTYVYVPSSVVYLGSEAFYYCVNLTTVELEAKISTIDMRSFQGCTSLTRFEVQHGVTTIGSDAFKGCTSLYKVTMPRTLTTIRSGAFNGCTALNKVTCYALTPPSLYDDNVFPTQAYNNAALEVPASAASAYHAANGWKLFSDFNELPYDFVLDNLKYVITSSTTVKCTGPVLIPAEGLWRVHDTAYEFDVTEIAEDAFFGCNRITSLEIGSNVNRIGSTAFYNCTGLTSMTLPESVEYVEGLAFFGCSSLREIVLGPNCRFNNSTSWSLNIFKGCTSLTSITCLSEQPWEFSEPMFEQSVYENAVVWVPGGTEAAYRNTDYWYKFSNIKGIYTLDEALNVEGGNLHFTTGGDYPWIVDVDGNGEPFAKSGNGGVHSSTSELETTVTVKEGTLLTFMMQARGEEGSRIYDECRFEIDGNEVFSYGVNPPEDWAISTTPLSAGTHTLTWTYTKDNSVHPAGDYFAIKNVELIDPQSIRGDVNGDGTVSISDVTALIDYLLSGAGAPAAADCNDDGEINISDVTTLIDFLLTSPDYYIVGSDPFGDWMPDAGVKMTKNADGSYSFTASVHGSIWFVFTSGLDSDWGVVNSQYRYGPSGGTDENVEVDVWKNAQRQKNGMGAYKFVGTGDEYVFRFIPDAGISPTTARFMVEGIVVVPPLTIFTVAGQPESVFGTEWDIYNESNDMTLTSSGEYELIKNNCFLTAGTSVEFKVVANHSWDYSWPLYESASLDIATTGYYNLRFTFNPETHSCSVQIL